MRGSAAIRICLLWGFPIHRTRFEAAISSFDLRLGLSSDGHFVRLNGRARNFLVVIDINGVRLQRRSDAKVVDVDVRDGNDR